MFLRGMLPFLAPHSLERLRAAAEAGTDQAARHSAHAAAHGGDAATSQRRGHPDRAGVPGTRLHRDHPALHARYEGTHVAGAAQAPPVFKSSREYEA
jgi:hypothetical protein